MSAENQRNDSSTERGQKLLIVLVILALVASIVMLFTGSVGALKLALLAALWAAILGMFLVSRYRAQAVASQAQLASEIELGQARLEEANQRFEADKATMQVELEHKIRSSEEENLKAIRRQLEELREQLEYLTGQSLVEPGMLRAQARRIMEIETAAEQVQQPVFKPQAQPQPAPSPSAEETAVISKVTVAADEPVGVGKQGKPAKQDRAEKADKADKPITAEFAVVTQVKQDPAAQEEATQAEHRAGEGKLSVSQLAAAAAKNSPYIGGKRRKPEEAENTSSVADTTAAEVAKETVDEPPAEQAPVSRGRRRRDEHSSAVSVADLLKRNQKET